MSIFNQTGGESSDLKIKTGTFTVKNVYTYIFSISGIDMQNIKQAYVVADTPDGRSLSMRAFFCDNDIKFHEFYNGMTSSNINPTHYIVMSGESTSDVEPTFKNGTLTVDISGTGIALFPNTIYKYTIIGN